MIEEYMNSVEGGEVTVDLTQEEEAAILASYDNGLLDMSPYEIGVIEEIIEKIVDEICI